MDLSKPQFGASSSWSSSSTHSFTHDVFLSFRGADTRNNFTGHLYRNLVQEGINTFIDNDLTRGEDIKNELLEVIERAKISIVVFSANYASSKWCLDELVKIFQCKESMQQMVYPIFYKVDPSEIRYQKGQVGDAIARLSKHKDNSEKVESWKAALTKAATLSGWHFLDGGYALKVLVEKALIKIEKDNEIWMHDLIEDMGKEIVRQESPNEIGQRSRLWLYEDVHEVLEENTGTDKIKGIVLRGGVYSQKIWLNSGSFTNLKNLQIFKVNYEMLYGEGVDYLPNQLRVLDWIDCSLRSLPTNFNPRKLGILHMGGPCTTALVNEGFKNMRYLKYIKMWRCHGLTRIPDLSGLTSLEYLTLSYCKDLVEVHPLVGRLDKLVFLKLSSCKKLQMFLKGINFKSLETLNLSGCSLKLFPEIEGEMKSLNRLNLNNTAIKELPCSVGNLTGLTSLTLSYNSAIKELPCSVGNLTGLRSLSLEGCDNLTNVPSSIFYALQRLEKLDLRYCSKLVTFPTKSESLPPPVFSTNLTRLQLHLDFCDRLEEISEFQLDGLFVSFCRLLERISKLSKILEGKYSKMFGRLDLTNCRRLCDNLARGVVSEVEVDKELFYVAKKRNKMTSSRFAGTKELMGEAEKLTALLTLFFSCAKSEEFQVEFPASVPLPNWFTCHQEVKSEEIKEHEFFIEIPQIPNWDNKGLALCIQLCSFKVTYFVYINGIKFDEKIMSGDEVWVHYIPFVTVIRRLSECGMPPPDMFRVMFRIEDSFPLSIKPFTGSWGVHLIQDLEWEGR
ncbi:hypothetical protein ABKV19_000478 [Rosa sericea]